MLRFMFEPYLCFPKQAAFLQICAKKVDNFVVLARILSLFLERQPKNMMALPTA